MFYKSIVGLLIGFLVACSDAEQATSANEAIVNLPKSEEPISMEKAREMAEAVEEEYYADKPKPVAPAPQPKEKRLDITHFSVSDFVMAQTKFSEIKSKLGDATFIRLSGEHHPEEKQVCYISEVEGDATLVLIGTGFYSGYKDFNSISVYSDKETFKKLGACSSSPLISKDIATSSGIKLFVSMDELRTILNGEGTLESDRFVYKGGYTTESDDGRKYYYYQNIVAEMNDKKEVTYFKVSMEYEL